MIVKAFVVIEHREGDASKIHGVYSSREITEKRKDCYVIEEYTVDPYQDKIDAGQFPWLVDVYPQGTPYTKKLIIQKFDPHLMVNDAQKFTCHVWAVTPKEAGEIAIARKEKLCAILNG